MKKNLLLFVMTLLAAVPLLAQESEIIIQTALPAGSQLTIKPEMASTSNPITIDWGDGVKAEPTDGDTNWRGEFISYRGEVKGQTIHIYGLFERMEIVEQQLTYFRAVSQDRLTRLTLNKNQLTTQKFDMAGAPNLTYLDLSNNNFTWLKFDSNPKLETITVNDNPEFNSAYFADPEGSFNAARSISFNNCDITHFYPVKMNNLQYLNIRNGSLWDIEIGDNYPSLSGLDLSGNERLAAVDVTKCASLYSLNLSNTAITELNVSQNTSLNSLEAANTKIDKITLQNNTALTSLNLSGSEISKLDIANLVGLKSVNVSNTRLNRLDLRQKRFLQYVRAANTDIEWLDMHHAVGYNQLRELDLRNCTKMTPQSLTFTFDAMPPHNGDSYQTNVFLEGTSYQTSHTDLLTDDPGNYYKPDFEGDGSASLSKVALTELPTTGGTYKLQRQGEWSDGAGNDPTIPSGYSQYLPFLDFTDGMVIPGRPVRVTDIIAEEGYEFVGVEVNGQFIDDNEFQISEPGTVKVIFKTQTNASVIKLTVPSASEQQYFLGADEDGTVITVDWGDGTPQEYTIGAKGNTYVGKEGSGTYGTTVTITGAVTRAIFDSYPYGMGTDNMISAIDLSGTSILKELSTYFNFDIESIDVSGQPDLEVLDVSMCDLDELNIANNPKLTDLRCYGNYFEQLNLSTAPNLETLDAHNNMFDEIDLSTTPKLKVVKLQNNSLSSINVAPLTQLEELDLAGNSLSDIDLAQNSNLVSLSIGNNKLSKLNIANNPYLLILNVAGNFIDKIDPSNQSYLYLVNVSSNGWSACTLDDFYTALNEFWLTDEQVKQTGMTTFLTAQEYSHSGYTDNDAAHSTTSIATAKGWIVNLTGDGTGCATNAIQVLGSDNAALLSVNGSELLVNAADGMPITIFDAAGSRIMSEPKGGQRAVTLHPGAYIVKVGNRATTVVVR